MGEEVRMTEYEGCDGDEDRVLEWETGLPDPDDLTPLTKHLIPPELASAFRISPEPCRTILDVNRASQTTLSNLRGGQSQGFSSSNNFKSFEERGRVDADPMVVGWEETTTNPDGSALDPRKLRKLDTTEEADSALRTENSTEVDPSARTLKRPRLVWTPQLHKRFVDVVAHLDIKNAVPKTIMQLMNVEGLTRENVASHLQKYRLYLKRMQGFSNEGPSASDHLFASTPVPQSLPESSSNGPGTGQLPVPIPMPYGPPQMVPMSLLGMSAASHGHMVGPLGNVGGYPYSMMHQQQQDWSGNKYGSMVSYPHHVGHYNSNDK